MQSWSQNGCLALVPQFLPDFWVVGCELRSEWQQVLWGLGGCKTAGVRPCDPILSLYQSHSIRNSVAPEKCSADTPIALIVLRMPVPNLLSRFLQSHHVGRKNTFSCSRLSCCRESSSSFEGPNSGQFRLDQFRCSCTIVPSASFPKCSKYVIGVTMCHVNSLARYFDPVWTLSPWQLSEGRSKGQSPQTLWDDRLASNVLSTVSEPVSETANGPGLKWHEN